MNRKTALIAVVAAGLMAAPGLARAQPMGGGWHRGGAEFMRGVTLTDAQKTRVHEIEKTSREQMRPIAEQMRDLHEQIATQLFAAGPVTQDQLKPLVDHQEQLRAQLDTQRLATALQLRAVLTPEQLAQSATLHQKLEDLHKQERALLAASRPNQP